MITDLKKIKRVVEMNTGLTDIQRRKRSRKFVDARTIYFIVSKNLTPHSYEKIGELVKRDHTTVTHAFTKIFESWKIQPNLFHVQLKMIEQIEKQILDVDLIQHDDGDFHKKILQEYQIKLIIKDKLIDRLNERINYLETKLKEYEKYVPIY